jgi:predicted metal-dependent hydrolase
VVRDERRTGARTIQAGGVSAQLVRKRVKNLTLRVYPPDGHVVVSAPLRMPERDVVAALHARRDWIERHRRRFAAVPRSAPLRCEGGETVSVLGVSHALRFAPRGAATEARSAGDAPSRSTAGPGPSSAAPALPHELPVLLVPASANAPRQARLAALRRRLRAVAEREFAAEVERWAPRLGVPMPTVQVRRMTSRWGTCHVRAGKVVLNLALVTRPRACLEYVVVHELAHLLVPDHSPRFWSVVARHLPGWRDARAALRAEPLWADAVWGPSADLGEAEEAR